MVPGAHVFLVSVAPFTAVRLCVFALSAVHGGRGGGGAHRGVGQLADRPAVNREVGGSSPPAPAHLVQCAVRQFRLAALTGLPAVSASSARNLAAFSGCLSESYAATRSFRASTSQLTPRSVRFASIS